MSQVRPFTGLTQPSLQGIVESGVFFTAFYRFEWYLILERWLPLAYFPILLFQHWQAVDGFSINLLSVNQGELPAARSTCRGLTYAAVERDQHRGQQVVDRPDHSAMQRLRLALQLLRGQPGRFPSLESG